MLGLLKTLIEFGFYTTFEELDGKDSLLKSLILILEGVKDVTSNEEYQMMREIMINPKKRKTRKAALLMQSFSVINRFTARYEETKENQVIQNVKKIIIEILEVILNLRISS